MSPPKNVKCSEVVHHRMVRICYVNLGLTLSPWPSLTDPSSPNSPWPVIRQELQANCPTLSILPTPLSLITFDLFIPQCNSTYPKIIYNLFLSAMWLQSFLQSFYWYLMLLMLLFAFLLLYEVWHNAFIPFLFGVVSFWAALLISFIQVLLPIKKKKKNLTISVTYKFYFCK